MSHVLPKKPTVRWLRVATLGIFGGLAATLVGFVALVIWDDTGPAQSQVCCDTPADWGPRGAKFRDVRLHSHGETLAGWYVPSIHGAAVILLHSGGIHRMGVMREGRALVDAGFGVLMYDRRAHGESTGAHNSSGWYDVADIPAALDYLRRQPDVDFDRLGVFGASIGGQVALRAAAVHPELRAVMADGPSLCGPRDHLPLSQLPAEKWPTRFLAPLARLMFEVRLGMRTPPAVVDVIGDIAPRPVYLIATSELERKVVQRYFDHAGAPRTLWQIPEAGHGGGFAARPEEYRQRLVGFFEQTLVGGRQGSDKMLN